MKIEFEMDIWQSGNKWHIANVKGVGTITNKWWFPARMLNMSLEDYLSMLVTYKSVNLDYSIETDTLVIAFDEERDARALKKQLNTLVRQKLRLNNWL